MSMDQLKVDSKQLAKVEREKYGRSYTLIGFHSIDRDLLHYTYEEAVGILCEVGLPDEIKSPVGLIQKNGQKYKVMVTLEKVDVNGEHPSGSADSPRGEISKTGGNHE